jgi:hypothetical protein
MKHEGSPFPVRYFERESSASAPIHSVDFHARMATIICHKT